MTRKGLINLKEAAAGHAWHCFTTIDITQACTPQQRDLLAAMDHVHAMVCRELQMFQADEEALMSIAEANGILQSIIEDDDPVAERIPDALHALQQASRKLRGGCVDA